jgi:L-aminopeptidase/D-esterase-like protein
MARTGSLGGNGSGDIFLAFSTASTGIAGESTANVRYLLNDYLDPLFFASAYASEEAIINSMIAGESMTGHKGLSVEALPHDKLVEILRDYNRLS